MAAGAGDEDRPDDETLARIVSAFARTTPASLPEFHTAGVLVIDRRLQELNRDMHRMAPIAMTRAFARALATKHGPYALLPGQDVRYRRAWLRLPDRTANREQYLYALYRVLARNRWQEIARRDGPDALVRYLHKSVRLEARKERAKDEMWSRRRRSSSRKPGRPGKVPIWVATSVFDMLLESSRLTPQQHRLALLLKSGVAPAEASRRLRVGPSVYIALRYKVLGRHTQRAKSRR
jgi:hypothetical protein